MFPWRGLWCCLPQAVAAALISGRERRPPGIGYGGPHPVRRVMAEEGGGASISAVSWPGLPAYGGSFPNGGAGAFAVVGADGCAERGFRWRRWRRISRRRRRRRGSGGSAAERGYSYVTDTARNAFGITGGNMNSSNPSGFSGERLCVDQLRRGPRAINLGDDAHGLRRARLARSPEETQAHAGLTRAFEAQRV